jgi:hypothetical protein
VRRVPPSTVIREEIDRLLSRGLEREANLLSELAELGLRYLVQQGLEQEQTDALGRGHYERRSEGEPGAVTAMGTRMLASRPLRERSRSRCLRCAAQRAPIARAWS